MQVMDNSDSDDRTSSTSTSSFGYNVPSTLAPNQRDLRKQAAVRNAAAAASAAVVANNNTDDEGQQQGQAEVKSRRPNLSPLDTASTAYVDKESAQTASKHASDAIFAQLEVIQNLQVHSNHNAGLSIPNYGSSQDEITREHAKLENLHNGDSDDTIPSTTTTSGGEALADPSSPTQSPKSKTKTDKQGGTTKPKPEKHTHGQGASAKERSAAHAYDELAAGFQERAKGVDAIMEKVRLTVVLFPWEQMRRILKEDIVSGSDESSLSLALTI